MTEQGASFTMKLFPVHYEKGVVPTNNTNSARDTHFAGFAKALWQTIEEELRSQGIYLDSGGSSEEWVAIMQPLLAQAAYDFAWHVIGCVGGGFETNQYLNDEDILRDLEDMTQWPRRNNACETQQSTP